jgi:FixJ family two-component response regulator
MAAQSAQLNTPAFTADTRAGTLGARPIDGQRVFLVDDDPSVVRGLSRLLREAGFEVSGFQSAPDYLHSYDKDVPGCAILDLALGAFHGLDLLRATARDDYARPTIFITGNSDIATAIRAMKVGAIDFLVKPINEDALIAAVQEAMARDREARAQAAARDAVTARLSKLTPRERDVLGKVVQGRLNKQIAADLNIAEKTVKFHRGRLMQKMNVRSVADLTRITMGGISSAPPP